MLLRFVVPTVATCVGLVVHLALARDGRRRVEEVVAVPDRAESDVIETEPVFIRVHGERERAGGQPPHPERFARVGIGLGALLAPLARPGDEVGALRTGGSSRSAATRPGTSTPAPYPALRLVPHA